MLRLDVDQLMSTAVTLTGHGEELAERHLRADNRIEAATAGWVGRSAAALGTRSERWTAASAAMLTRLGAHATDLHSCALLIAAAERDNAAALSGDSGAVRQLAVRQPVAAIR